MFQHWAECIKKKNTAQKYKNRLKTSLSQIDQGPILCIIYKPLIISSKIAYIFRKPNNKI